MNEANRAILLNIGVFGANQNLRRNLNTISANYQSFSCGQSYGVQSVCGGETWTLKPPSTPTKICVIAVTNPIKATVTQSTVAGRSANTFDVIINQTFVLDDSVSEITFKNESTAITSTISYIIG
jgi:hypothetical protein